MSLQEQAIERIYKFAVNFSNMDTFFIDPRLQVKQEYLHTQVPEQLKPYLGNVLELLGFIDINSGYDVVFYCNSYKLNFIAARVYDEAEFLGCIIVGPYLLEEPNILMIQNILFKNNSPLSLSHVIRQYYQSLPMISTHKAKIIAEFLGYSTSNLKSLFDNEPKIGKLEYDFQNQFSATSETVKLSSEVSMTIIEKRYNRENELMALIEHGNMERLEKLLQEDTFFLNKIPDRIPNDPLRSRKNLTFVLNTLLRKASEKGGVHPVYIHSISEKFAIQIEKTTSIQQLLELRNKMFFSYCDAVRKLSLKDYSFLIKKAVEFIRLNFDQDLSLEAISHAVNVSPYELSRQFKSETGESIVDYINKQRVNEAVSMMENPNMNITNIAHTVGFNDVNYFTKVFKKFKGLTPTDYRKNRN